MNRFQLSLLSLLPALAAALLLSACAGSSGNGKATITLYNGQHEQTTALLVAAFERQTHIKVEVRSGDEATLASQIEQEGSNSPADVFYTENTPVLEALREKGLLAPVRPSTLAAVPSRYDSATGDWVGISARDSVLVYNTPRRSRPRSYRATSSNWPSRSGKASSASLRRRPTPSR
jgi:iron(III) transport system substrate-binding protein